MDKFNEMTGAELPDDLYAVGVKVDDALKKEMAKDKAKTNAKYAAANKSEEAQTPVDLTHQVDVTGEPTTLIDYLNKTVEGTTEPIIPTARKLAVHHGLAIEDLDGQLLPANPTLQQMEKFRQDIGAKIDSKQGADIRQGSIIKDFVDAHTEPFERNLYKNARVS